MLIKYDDQIQLSTFGLLCNTGEAGVFSNVKANDALGLPVVDEYKPRPAIICGGGPSLADTLVNIRALKAAGGKVFALNNAARFLSEHGIKPDAQIIIDPRPQNVEFVSEVWAEEALLCSQCHPSLFAKCKAIGYPVRLWHPAIEGIEKYIADKSPLLVSSTLSVGLSCLSLIHVMGHREFHLFGYDSSHKAEASHAYAQPMNAGDEIVRCVVDSEVFNASMQMAGQANDFKQVTDMLEGVGTKIHVYGSGLVPFMWRQWERERNLKVLTACYDLGVSPPTYDFLSFLVEAERYRLEKKFDVIDVIFQPGPMHGFRDDQLPPDVETRKNMLWGVCAAMAKRLPSVRNIELLGKRRPVEKDTFPPEWAENKPYAHYATAFLKNGTPMLKASGYAKKQAAKISKNERYATITLRQADYWPARNSKIEEWEKVCAWLWLQNIVPIIIPDADGGTFPPPYAICPQAAVDIDLRCGLYEGAIINLGVLNGPMSLCAFLDCRYLIFKAGGGDEMAAGSDAFLKVHGFERGDGFGGNGKMIWKPDDAQTIIAELQEFAVQPKERTSND